MTETLRSREALCAEFKPLLSDADRRLWSTHSEHMLAGMREAMRQHGGGAGWDNVAWIGGWDVRISQGRPASSAAATDATSLNACTKEERSSSSPTTIRAPAQQGSPREQTQAIARAFEQRRAPQESPRDRAALNAWPRGPAQGLARRQRPSRRQLPFHGGHRDLLTRSCASVIRLSSVTSVS